MQLANHSLPSQSMPYIFSNLSDVTGHRRNLKLKRKTIIEHY